MNAAPENKLYDLVEIDEDHLKGTAFNMLFMVWRHRTLVDAYRRGMKIAQKLSTQHQMGAGVCQVVEVACVAPDTAARAAFVDFVRLPEVDHLSVIHDGTGFKAASVRAVMTGVHALARPQCKLSVHSTVGGAARWAASMQLKLGRTEQAARIESIVTALRAHHRERYP